MMKKTRRTYDREFKLEVVRRSLEEMSVKDLGKELGIHPAVISRWRKEFLETEDQKVVFPGKSKELISFFNTLKVEWTNQFVYEDIDEARKSIFE